jgi:D-alanyl-D-alanine carboxypeptidase/D-alanyl-D-alanine-endopeptidase (penicillin-binding protein 4)
LGQRKLGKGSFESGAKVVRTWLKDIGAPDSEQLQMHDGSGLARADLVEPRQTCCLMRRMMKAGKAGEAFVESLPIGGVDGSLGDRLKDPSTKGNVKAKTGYISYVRSLSGYVTTADGETLVFSMMCNEYTIPTAQVNASQDEACKILAQFKDKAGE